MHAKLKGMSLQNVCSEIPLDRLPVTIGRSPHVTVQIEDQWLSRRHCLIREVAGTLMIRDLESRNGTLVNGEPVSESPLVDGDLVQLGLSVFEVQYAVDPSGIYSNAATV